MIQNTDALHILPKNLADQEIVCHQFEFYLFFIGDQRLDLANARETGIKVRHNQIDPMNVYDLRSIVVYSGWLTLLDSLFKLAIDMAISNIVNKQGYDY
jgi:hypothetical protein